MTAAARPMEVVGGGLAGLGLGLGLRRRGVAVMLREAGTYPRHRVCGEFITGLDEGTISALGLAPLLADALLLRGVAWMRDGRVMRRQRLPEPARAISRRALDARLAEAFVAAGGELRTGERVPLAAGGAGDAAPGRVYAVGRRPQRRSRWLGVKVHVRGLALADDLEMHLVRGGYVGLAPVAGEAAGTVNVCGLLGIAERGGRIVEWAAGARGEAERVAGGISVGAGYLLARLERAGAGALAARLRAAEVVAESFCSVAGLDYGAPPAGAGGLAVGDAAALVPPFAGQGMAQAWRGAAAVLPALEAYARGELAWPQAVAEAREALEHRTARRRRVARWLHGWLTHPLGQGVLAATARAGLLPLRPLYQLTH